MGRRGRRETVKQQQRSAGRLALISFIIATVIGVAGLSIALWARLDRSGESSASTQRPRASVFDQRLQIRVRLAREGWSVTGSREVALRGDGRRSTILTLSPRRPACTTTMPSDQVRIYDVTGGIVRQAFKFQPTARGCSTRYQFRVLRVGEFEEDENIRDIIAAFSNDDIGSVQVPVVIKWNADSQKYDLRGLMTAATRNSPLVAT